MKITEQLNRLKGIGAAARSAEETKRVEYHSNAQRVTQATGILALEKRLDRALLTDEARTALQGWWAAHEEAILSARPLGPEDTTHLNQTVPILAEGVEDLYQSVSQLPALGRAEA